MSRTPVRKWASFPFQGYKQALRASEEHVLKSLDLEAVWQSLSSQVKSPCWHK